MFLGIPQKTTFSFIFVGFGIGATLCIGFIVSRIQCFPYAGFFLRKHITYKILQKPLQDDTQH